MRSRDLNLLYYYYKLYLPIVPGTGTWYCTLPGNTWYRLPRTGTGTRTSDTTQYSYEYQVELQ